MNTNGKMVSCDDCIYDNKFGSWNCVGCVAKSNFVPRSKSRIYYKSVQEMNQPPAAYIAMTEALKSFGVPKIRKTKTFVKAVYDEFDPEKGLAMAIAKKALGNKYSYFDVIKKWVDKYLEKEDK